MGNFLKKLFGFDNAVSTVDVKPVNKFTCASYVANYAVKTNSTKKAKYNRNNSDEDSRFVTATHYRFGNTLFEL